MSPGNFRKKRSPVAKTLTFRQDIRRKLILVSLIPMLVIGLLGALLIYQAEESLMVNEHKQLLHTTDLLIRDHYRRLRKLLQALRQQIAEDETVSVAKAMNFIPEIDSIVEVDERGRIRRLLHRSPAGRSAKVLDPRLKDLIRRTLQQKRKEAEAFYYDKASDKVFFSKAFRYGANYYFIQTDLSPLFQQISHLIKKERDRGLSIIDAQREILYDSRNPQSVSNGSFFDQGVYEIAVKEQPPYTMTEFPEHYRPGDPFWKRLFDTDNFLSYTRIPGFDWIVTVREYSDTLDAYLKTLIFWGAVLILFIVMTVLVSAKIISDRTVKPVEKIIERLDRFARGERTDSPRLRGTTYPIFIKLIKSFNTMQEKINTREKELKEQIDSNKQMQLRLIQQEKLAAMGEMIGNIAHQWRQPLSVISTLATGVKTEQEMGILDEKNLIESCTQINHNVQYLSQTIDDFRQFIKGDHHKERFSAPRLIERLFRLIGVQLEHHQITPILSVEENLQLYGYFNELIQAIVNLVSNAKDALDAVPQEDRYLFIDLRRTETGEVNLSVRDTGGGIDEEILGRIFEPYFTTKDKSQGTGLGLYMTHRLIVEGMRGTVQAKNVSFSYNGKSYRGAEFTITLPKESIEEAE